MQQTSVTTLSIQTIASKYMYFVTFSIRNVQQKHSKTCSPTSSFIAPPVLAKVGFSRLSEDQIVKPMLWIATDKLTVA